MSAEDANARLRQAEQTNRRRDNGERAAGFAAPPDGPMDTTVRTAICALHCGLVLEDWDCIAEGVAILGELVDFKPWQEVAT